jgi:ABC-type nitrate/sulfonate/bicarbonate transport system substrate-binding protein
VYEALMAKLSIDRSQITEVAVGFDLTPLLTGAIDVTTAGYISNQPIVAESQGHRVNIIDPHDYGVRVGGNVVFTTEDNLRKKRPQIKRFLRAMIDAIALSQQLSDDDVVDIVLKYNDKLNRDNELNIWAVTKDQLLCKDSSRIGLMPEETWKETAVLFNHYGALKSIPQLDKAYTNKLVEEVLTEKRLRAN